MRIFSAQIVTTIKRELTDIEINKKDWKYTNFCSRMNFLFVKHDFNFAFTTAHNLFCVKNNF